MLFVYKERLKIEIDLCSGSTTGATYQEEIFETVSSFLHEGFYHGNNFEKQFFGKNYTIIEKEYTSGLIGEVYNSGVIAPFISPKHVHKHHTNSNDIPALRVSVSNSLFGKQAITILNQINQQYNLHYSRIQMLKIVGVGMTGFRLDDLDKLRK